MYTKTLLLALVAAVSVSGAAIDVRQANNNACNAGAAVGNNNNQNNNNANAGNANAGNAANAAADFGSCTPTMDFQLGRAGRKPDEATFLPVDPVVAKGQQDALNPNIITNRICDQLTNVCDANDAAKALCAQAQAAVQAAGTKDATTADLFNQALGF
ncbi:hypothetical protein GE09DRAFT_1166084 [Coniochaeta sp. 2T2.1]|nr:hypothetical protein GE09DRAFT_1166084 [Coniochaeta sp. 2T2.1]